MLLFDADIQYVPMSMRRSGLLLVAVLLAACGSSPTDPTQGAGGASTSAATTSSAGGSGGSGGAGGDLAGRIVSRSSDTLLEAETSVAVASSGVVAAAWIAVPMGGQDTWIGTSFSTDGGATWSPPGAAHSPGGRAATDPTLVTDASGAFYLAWLGYKPGPNAPSDMHLYVAKADAGATSFGAPVEASDPKVLSAAYDKPWLVRTEKGTLLVTYSSQTSGFDLLAARSADGGATWKVAIIASDPSSKVFRNLAFVCTGAGGARLHVAFAQLGPAGAEIHVMASDDDGVTWTGDTRVSTAGEQVAFDDPTCVAAGNDLWIAYSLTKDGSVMDAKDSMIRLAHSSDGGMSIADRTDVGDAAAGAFFLHPTLGREASGALDLVYYVASADGDKEGAYRRSRAVTPGGPFGPSIVVAHPVTFQSKRQMVDWLGDYTGLFLQGGDLYTTYVDNSSGASHVAFAREKLE
jgi:hypothetical protein